MNYDFKKLPESKIELKVSLSEEEFGPFLDKALEHLAIHAELPGFRKGKAPKELVLQKYGEFAVFEEAAETAINNTFLKIVEEKKLEPIGKPEVAVRKLAPKNPFEFDVVFEIMPEVKILEKYKNELKKLKKERKQAILDEKETEQSLAWLARSRAEFIESLEPAKMKDWLTADLLLNHQGKPVEDGRQDGFRFCLEDGSLFPGFAEKIVGSRTNDRVCFSLKAPDNYWKKDIAGKEIDFDVFVKKIESEKLPELDDNFAQSLGKFNNFQELRKNIEDGLLKEVEQKAREGFRLRLLSRISELSEIDLPKILVDREKHNMLHELKSSIESNHLDWQGYLSQIKKTEEEITSEFDDKARERLRFALILEKIAEQESIEPTEEEVENEANKVLAQFKNLKEAEKSIDAYQLTAYTKGILKNEKVSQYLEELALAE
ncbi:MAG: trigger factor [Candidatus Brennerbacteria bacterium RIFOXYC1_FULL_41_11]|nr:MAG: Trigger factor [Parcubacteria group bacterium GW2011_GWB1_41_4]OGY39899.1 MAG: trigger factor [Candidatus Brennerbacteria bacterium RIFOXYC1_FULL_41_11]